LKGTFYNNKWTQEGFERGIEYLNQALQKEPLNARAYAGLAVAYGGLGIYGDITGYPQQKSAALKALQIDDTLAEATTPWPGRSLPTIGTPPARNRNSAAPSNWRLVPDRNRTQGRLLLLPKGSYLKQCLAHAGA